MTTQSSALVAREINDGTQLPSVCRHSGTAVIDFDPVAMVVAAAASSGTAKSKEKFVSSATAGKDSMARWAVAPRA